MFEGFPDDVAAFDFHGHVTKRDDDTVLISGFEGRLTRHKKVAIYGEIATDVAGFRQASLCRGIGVDTTVALPGWGKGSQ